MSTKKITNSFLGQISFKKFITVLSLLLLGVNSWGQTAYNLASGNKTWNFSDIANWSNNFASGVDALNWGSVGINATGTIPNGIKTTVSSASFSTTTAGGVQKGTQNIYLLSTGATGNTNSVAVDLFLNYTNRIVGTISFDYACVFNSTGDRGSSLKVYTSINGTTWTELTPAALSVVNNVASSGTKSSIILPSSFSGSSTARIRFYQYNDNVGTSGSRPKISLDNINITSTSSAYSVTFDANGGSGTMTNQSGSTTTALTSNTFARTGYTFAGWSTSAGGSVDYLDGASYPFTSSTTLYAQWTANNNTLTFDGNGSTSGATAAQTIATNASAALTTNGFDKTGYTFAGWSTTAGGSVAYANGVSYTMGTSNATVYAVWTANNNTLTFDGNGSTSGSTAAQTIASNASATLTSNGFVYTGYNFSGWSTTAGGSVAYANGVSYTMGTSNATLYAVWTLATAPTISYSGSLASVNTTYGTASSSPTSFSVSGSNLTNDISISAPSGYEIAVGSGTYASSQTLTQTSGAVANTTINVRLAATTAAGTYSGNIALTSNGATSLNVPTVSSTVSPKALTISGLTGTNKEYDGATAATFSGTASYDGLENGESFSVSGTPSATFTTASVGTNKPITLVGYTEPSANYSLTQPSLSADITAKELTVSSAIATDKAYNGTTTATITGGTLVGVVSPEVLTLTQAGNFVSADAGTGISVTGNFSISGTTSSNYTISQPSGLSANITQALQTITFNTLSNQALGAADYNPGATINTGLTITYTSSNPAVATIVNGNIHLVASGTTIITASQAGNGNYAAASDVSQNLTVQQIIAAWDFTGYTSTSTVPATNYNANLVSSGINITRGSGAAASAGANSFRTVGFQNNGISTSNTDYFQITFTASPCFKLSLTSIDAKFNGTAGFYGSPGVTSQFAYSLNGTNFTLIGSPVTSTSLNMALVDLSSSTELQNISAGTTVTIRYYASGQTTTGGWGFYSSAVGDYGLSIGGTLTVVPTSAPTAADQSFCSSTSPTVSNLSATGSSIKWYEASSGGSALTTSTGLTNNATLYASQTVTGCESATRASSTITLTSDNTASAASSSPTVSINTALTAITHTTTGATGIGTATGLPAGVTAAWASNTITISGTPTASGNFSYSIPLTGGCGSVNATGTINVTADNTASAASSSPTLCINTALTDITHTTTGATGIGTATGLPAGVTAAWASNTITISGTPTASGNFSYSIPLTGGSGSVNASGTINVSAVNTVGAASSTPTVSINTALTAITHTTTGATGIGTATGLPAGVTAAWASNSITISGTPTASGNFSYSIPLTGGCGSVNATGTINVTADNTASAASSSPTLCINTALTDIAHTTTGATGIGTATGLPAGVTAAWASNTITISGTPTANGNFSYSIPLTGGSGSVNATGTINVSAINTVGAASSTPTVSINTALTAITHTTTGATGIGTATGLPAGVTAAWASNTITISGTPTASGNFSYSIPLTGGCSNLNATGTITVTANNTAGAASSSPTLCINTALTNITHTTTGATGIGTATGLPAGVTAAWASDTITISGSPTASGNFSYSIPLTGVSGSINATGTINVSAINTVGPASSSPTVSINTALTAITHTTTGATGIGTATGLPAGVTAAWTSNTITISGTPTASGNFSYSIPLTGGCSNLNATGTITVTANNTAGAASSSPTLCINTALTNITHTTTGATGIGTATGLPAGVTAAWASDTITISGSPTASGNFSYSIPLTGVSGSINATGTINVSAINTVSTASSSPTVSINTALTAITHTTTGATGIGTATGLPAGVTAAWASNTITISGTPTASGNFSYSIPLTGGCSSLNATGTINVIVACPTDFDYNGLTDVDDFVIFAPKFGTTNVGVSPTDLNNDGVTDVDDFVIFAPKFGTNCN
jgi:uncharacterized repeat protein (TIGR02543 family)